MGVSAIDPRRRAARVLAAATALALVASLAATTGLGAGRVAAAGDPNPYFSTQPLGANIGGPVAVGEPGVVWPIQPVVSFMGDVDPTYSYTVSLQIDPSTPDSGGPGYLWCGGGNSVDMSGGIAAFSGCRIDAPGEGYALMATITGQTSSGTILSPMSTTSLTFSIRESGPSPIATQIQFTTQPLGANLGGPRPSAPAGQTWGIQPVVAVLDDRGSVVTSDNTTIIGLSIEAGTPQDALPGSLSCASGTSLRVRQGVARFSGCSISSPGTAYQLDATTYSTGSTLQLADISLPFDITGGSRPARAKFTTEPLGANLGGAVPSATSGTPWQIQPVVSVVDSTGHVVANDFSTLVTLSIDSASPAGGQLYCSSGTVIQVLGGVAPFSGCQIVGAGHGYVLRATAQSTGGALIYDRSLPFDITATASALDLQPSTFQVSPNGALTLTATLMGSGTGSQTIVFQRQQAGDTGWVNVGTSITNGSGIATLTFKPRYTASYRATFAGSGSLAAATSAVDTISVKASVSLTPTRSSVKKGTTIKYTAKVAPAPMASTAVRFVISRYVSGAWTYFTQRAAKVSTSGVATLSWKWSTAGKWRIQAIAPTSLYYAQGASKTIAVTVK